MTRHPLTLALLATLFAAAPAVASDTLTVYSGDFDAVSQSEPQSGGPGFALVERKVGFDLRAGDNAVSLGGLPLALDAGSVRLAPRGDARVLGQRFDFALASQDELLRRALGQSVTVEQAVGSERRSLTGTLVAAGNGLTLRLPDGRIKVLADYASFELAKMPAGIVNEPTLAWSLASARGGRQDFDLSYATGGLAWRAEYRVDTQGLGRDCRLALDGAAMVVNRSGADFNDVRLTLVAGEPNRSQGGASPRVMMAAAPMAKTMEADVAPSPQASGEYQSYTLPNPGSLPQGSVQRLPLVAPTPGVACERRYETNATIGSWTPPQPIIDAGFNAAEDQPQPVLARLRFANEAKAGLGVPLPAGRVRVFEGSDFLGEADLGHTPAGAPVTLTLGNVFDLRAERKREEFHLDRAGRTMTETIAITLRNAKPAAVTVQVNERLPRWTDWDIVSSSVPASKRGAQAASFDVSVPAKGEATLRYTVRYRWAADVTIP